MSAQQDLPLPSPASNTVVFNARCSLRIEADQARDHRRRTDAVAEAYAMMFLVEQGFTRQIDVARAFGRSVRTVRRHASSMANRSRMQRRSIRSSSPILT
jgi:hypothetical protein